MCNIKKLIIKNFICLVLCFSFITNVYADGWINDGANWQYEENGKLVRGDVRNIDGVNYYFDTYGNWIPRDENVSYKLKATETKSFTLEGEDYKNRKYKVKYTYLLPIVDGENAEAVNKFISENIEKTIGDFILEKYGQALFLLTEMSNMELIDMHNEKDTIAFSYLGSPRYSLYVNYKKSIMWIVQ